MTPRYKLRPDSGELQEYLFEYNGILALKNFVARVDGERLILHSASDMNFSILDALVSEVEIDGRVYDTPEAAQQALQRLTFNTNRPVLMTQRERELLEGALQRGTYVGTAADLKALLDRKVDKVPGKMLSTNDFTNELRTKLEGLRQVDISGLLPKGGYTGTAQNLKELIDNIMRILQSPDTELDELREIVAYIKQNKRVLDTLGISNIAGLQDALNGKAPTDHHHDDRYSRLGHTHSEYALRTHRHHWDNIDGIPALATEGKIAEAIGKIQVGGRNYVLKSNDRHNSLIKTYPISQEFIKNIRKGDPVVVSLFIEFTRLVALTGHGRIGAEFSIYYVDNTMDYVWSWVNFSASDIGKGYKGRFSFVNQINPNKEILRVTDNIGLHVQCEVEGLSIGMPKVEIGNTPTDWTPAPEDLSLKNTSIEENWTATDEWADRTVFVQGSCNVELNQLPHLASISFRKALVGGAVTFTCAGKTIIYTGDNAFNGGEGSTAVVSIWNHKCYIDIRNV